MLIPPKPPCHSPPPPVTTHCGISALCHLSLHHVGPFVVPQSTDQHTHNWTDSSPSELTAVSDYQGNKVPMMRQNMLGLSLTLSAVRASKHFLPPAFLELDTSRFCTSFQKKLDTSASAYCPYIPQSSSIFLQISLHLPTPPLQHQVRHHSFLCKPSFKVPIDTLEIKSPTSRGQN